MQPFLTVQAQQRIGAASTVVRDVRGSVGTIRTRATLTPGIDVFENEVIETAGESATQLRFQDDTNLTIGPDARLTLDRFVFDPDPGRQAVGLTLLVGTARFVTGNMAKNAYTIRTPTATIGVRGTILEIAVAANGVTQVNVIEGAVSVTTAAGASATTVNAGLSTSVAPGAPPTPPAPPTGPLPGVAQMNTAMAQAGPAPGGAAGSASGSGGTGGGISTGLIAGVAAAAAIAIAIGVAVTSDDGNKKGGSASTSTSTATAGGQR